MRLVAVCGCAILVAVTTAAWALDEAILTPTEVVQVVGVSAEESAKAQAGADKTFESAMAVWNTHRYAEGTKLLREFSAKHPGSRWKAEADLHVGCYLTYVERYDEARSIFDGAKAAHPGTSIATKASIRLGNIAEREGKLDEALKHYAGVLRMNPTWDQFKYANYRARKLLMTRGRRQGLITCGPVALAACFEALGKPAEAAVARQIVPPDEGLSLAVMEAHARMYGIPARCVGMSVEDLKSAAVPVLAALNPNHFVAITGVKDGRATVEDSIHGKREVAIADLERAWAGRALVFGASDGLQPLTLAASLETLGGCCGQTDEDECLGNPCDCQQTGSDGIGGNGGCLSCGSRGRPTWSVNTINMNLLVRDTPIWYDPGKGPMIDFTLTYSNENSNTGVFGRGWRCQYDMKVFFLPSDIDGVPTLQLHRADGRIETYVPTEESAPQRLAYEASPASDPGPLQREYEPRPGMAAYGYRDTMEVAQGTSVIPVIRLRNGGRWEFVAEGEPAEGRIRYIEDAAGNRVECLYNSTGALTGVKDANGRVTTITTDGVGIDERVTGVQIPDGRSASFTYTDGNLTEIEDMLEVASTLKYEAVMFYPNHVVAQTLLAQDVTTTSPSTGQMLSVQSTDYFHPSGKIKIDDREVMSYTGKTTTTLAGIERTSPEIAERGDEVVQVLPSALLDQDITTTLPGNGQDILVDPTTPLGDFPDHGWVAIEPLNSGSYEIVHYSSRTATAFVNITRGDPRSIVCSGARVVVRWL